MSKVVSWGHWLVAGIFAANGFLAFRAQSLTNALKKQDSFYPVYLDAMICAILLICAWGIMKWRKWGRSLGMAIAGFQLLVFVQGTFLLAREGRGVTFDWVLSIVLASLLLWLLLPAVRAEFLRRNQIA